MKKIVLMASLLMSLSYAASAQLKFGLRVAPNIAFNRVADKKSDDGVSYDNNGAGVRFSAGVVADYFFSERAAFSTGLWYTAKRAGIKASWAGGSTKVAYNNQFVQLPVSLKFYTDDLNDGMKLYFQLGGTIDVKISEKLKEGTVAKPDEKYFLPVDAGLLLGSGIEMELSESTKFFTGLSYNRGLLNMVKDSDSRKAYRLGQSLLSIEAGLKF
ncbi:porin family protein [Flexibacter flexilis]|nr:porin family protein [Flexibacter flexilis]